jgi:VWFA-related protein
VERVRLPRLVFVCLLIASTAASHRVLSQSASAVPPQSPTPHSHTPQAPPPQAPAPPQTAPPPTTQPGAQPATAAQPTFRVGATFVHVDAFITKDGRPVTDLKADDFDLFEDGVRQTIRNFEFVNIPSAVSQGASRRDPQTVADMRERVADPRRRVFVLFIDTYHISQGASMSSRQAFLRFLQRIVGPDDLIAGMTPEMSPESLSFGARTESLESFLNDLWGRRDAIRQDPEEDWMQTCFSSPNRVKSWPVVRERRRTKLALDALEGLVARLGAMRDERKAIITVTEGWEFSREDLNLLDDPIRPIHTGPTGIVHVPGSGFGTSDPRTGGAPSAGECDKVLLDLASIETTQQFRDLPDVANRSNASFYIIDPRGLAASDNLLGSSSPSADIAMLKYKLDKLRELADRTDGMAMFLNNSLDTSLTRIAEDLSSYYLLGYDSTNGKLDGTYRTLSVKVKRPGVLVRARRGYRAGTLPSAGVSNSRTGGSAAPPVVNEITSAVGTIMATRADLPVRLRATAVRLSATPADHDASAATSELRLVAELDPKLAASDAWRQGGTAHFIVRKDAGAAASLSTDATLQAGARVLTATIALPNELPAGEYRVQLRLTAQSHTDALSDATTVQVSAPSLIATPALFKRGPSTGTAYLPTADLRFRRADRLRLEAPSRLSAAQVRVTAVDQRGQPLNLPIQVSDRQDGPRTLIVADISLAPLAPGGYAIIVTTGAETSTANPSRTDDASKASGERVIVPFQLIP